MAKVQAGMMIADPDELMVQMTKLNTAIEGLVGEYNSYCKEIEDLENLGKNVGEIRNKAMEISALLTKAQEHTAEGVTQCKQFVEDVKAITDVNITL